MSALTSLALAALAQGAGGPSPLPQSASGLSPLRVAIEAPRYHVAGNPLKVRLTIENAGSETASVPARWAVGDGVLVRAIEPTAAAKARAGAVAAAAVDLTARPARPRDASSGADAHVADIPLPPGARLVLPITIERSELPATDAFDVLFVSEKPDAAADATRVEQVEDLRGARAVLETDMGRIVFALAPEAAPLACRNFVKLAESGFYNGVTFHYVAKGLCIQAGDPKTKTSDALALGTGGSTYDGRPLPLERSQAAFARGTVAVARLGDEAYRQVRIALARSFEAKDDVELDAKLRSIGWISALQLLERREFLESGASQFFILTTEAPSYVGRYSAFAKVVEGLDVVAAIESTEVQGAEAPSPFLAERPKKPIRIRSVTIQRATPGAATNGAALTGKGSNDRAAEASPSHRK